MIDGFEYFTKDVKADDMPTIRLLARSLNLRIGKDNAITNKKIRKCFEENNGIKIGDPKLRKYIQFIRVKGMVKHLCASSNGYYRAETKEEWLKFREGYRSRTNAMRYTLECLDKEIFV